MVRVRESHNYRGSLISELYKYWNFFYETDFETPFKEPK